MTGSLIVGLDDGDGIEESRSSGWHLKVCENDEESLGPQTAPPAG